MDGYVSLKDQIACVQRELAMRRTVYPRLIASGRMTPVRAQREIATMEAVLATLQHMQTEEC